MAVKYSLIIPVLSYTLSGSPDDKAIISHLCTSVVENSPFSLNLLLNTVVSLKSTFLKMTVSTFPHADNTFVEFSYNSS